MYQVNKKGRMYRPGKSLDGDLRRLILDKCLAGRGDRLTGELPISNKIVADQVQVTVNTVSRVWRRFCSDSMEDPLPSGGDFSSKLTAGDLELIETLKTVKGSIHLRELYAILEEILQDKYLCQQFREQSKLSFYLDSVILESV